MAAVIVLAISLVIVRDIPNGRVTPPGRPAHAVDGGTSASPRGSGPTTTTPPSAARATGPASATTTASPTARAGSTPPTPTTSTSTSTSSAFVPMQTATGGEFYSPSGNIECQVQVQSQAGPAGAYCQTTAPARSVTMNADGHYTVCTGQQCLANAGEGTPTLAYGTVTGVGPFRCESAAAGVTCTADGRGFLISAAGITAAPA